MFKRTIMCIGVIFTLILTVQVYGLNSSDDFYIPQKYLKQGVTGTGLDDFASLGTGVLASQTLGYSQITVDPPDRLMNSVVLGEWATAGNLEEWTGTNVTGLAATGGYLTGTSYAATAIPPFLRCYTSREPTTCTGLSDQYNNSYKINACPTVMG